MLCRRYFPASQTARLRARNCRASGAGACRKEIHQRRNLRPNRRTRTLMRDAADTTELAVAKGVVSRRYPRAGEDPAVAKRALQALLRRGFSYEIAREALRVGK